MTVDEFIAKYNGKGVDFDGAYGNQCWDLVAQYSKEVVGLQGGAWDVMPTGPNGGAIEVFTVFKNPLGTYYDKIANSPDPTNLPKKGDIVIWNWGTFGHIAIVTGATSASISVFEQNSPVGSLAHLTPNKQWSGCVGWIRPKTKGDTMNTEAGTELYRTALFREAESPAGASQWNGQTPAQALRAVRGAEWQSIKGRLDAYATLQAKVAELSARPTKDELQTLVQTANTERDKVALLETQLAEEKAKPPVEVVKNPSWLNSVIDFINNLLRSKK